MSLRGSTIPSTVQLASLVLESRIIVSFRCRSSERSRQYCALPRTIWQTPDPFGYCFTFSATSDGSRLRFENAARGMNEVTATKRGSEISSAGMPCKEEEDSGHSGRVALFGRRLPHRFGTSAEPHAIRQGRAGGTRIYVTF